MRLEVTLANRGELAGFLEREGRATLRAVARATETAANAVKEAARAEVRRAFPNARSNFAGGIRSKLFGPKDNPEAALVYSAIGRRGAGGFIDYLALFERDRVLTGRGSGWLIVPLVKGGARVLDAQAQELRQRGIFTSGRLRFLVGRDRGVELIPTKNRGVFLLVRRTGRFTGTANTTHLDVLALVLRRVRVKKRVDFTGLIGIRDQAIAETLNSELNRNG